MKNYVLSTGCVLLLMGSSLAVAAEPEPALGGYCPVCLVKMNEVVKGDPSFSSTYDGRTYLFPGAEQKRMFDANPTAFVPALGGACTVCKVEKGKRVPGKAEFHLTHNGRLFLFPSQKQLGMFQANPDRYANADVAMDGYCPVCKIEMGKDVKGKPDFAVDYEGKRYLFPGQKQLDMFQRDPVKYAVN